MIGVHNSDLLGVHLHPLQFAALVINYRQLYCLIDITPQVESGHPAWIDPIGHHFGLLQRLTPNGSHLESRIEVKVETAVDHQLHFTQFWLGILGGVLVAFELKTIIHILQLIAAFYSFLILHYPYSAVANTDFLVLHHLSEVSHLLVYNVLRILVCLLVLLDVLLLYLDGANHS